jgi:hypothetical protein
MTTAPRRQPQGIRLVVTKEFSQTMKFFFNVPKEKSLTFDSGKIESPEILI